VLSYGPGCDEIGIVPGRPAAPTSARLGLIDRTGIGSLSAAYHLLLSSLTLPEKFTINGRVPCKAIQELPARKDCAILSSPKPQVERSKSEDYQYGQKPAGGIAETGGGYSRNPIRVSRVPFQAELSGEFVTSFIDRVAQAGVARQGLAGDADPAAATSTSISATPGSLPILARTAWAQ